MAAASVTVELLALTGSFITDTGRAEKSMRSFKKEALDTQRTLKNAFAGISGLVSFAGFASFGKEAIEAARDAEQASARIIATLKATNYAAGVTMNQLDDLAESLAQSTQFDDDDIRNAEAAFLKFGNIQKDVFERGIKLSTDLAAFMGTDVASAAQTVGKALSSPADSVGTLERQIGKLTKTQEDSIKKFLETGDAARAQAAILDILQSKIGGTAKEMNTGWTKATKDVDKAWGELLETVGKTNFAQNEFTALSQILTDIKGQLEGTSNTYRNTLAQMARDTAKYLPGLPTLLLGNGVGNLLEAPNRQEASGKIKFNAPTPAPVSIPSLPGLSGRSKSSNKGNSLADIQLDFRIDDFQKMGRELEIEGQRIASINEFIADSFEDESKRIKDALGDDDAIKDIRKLKDEAASIYAATRTPLENFTAQMQKVKELLDKGLITPDTAGREMQQRHDEFVQRNKQTTDKITEFWKQAARNMEDAMGGFFFDVMQGELGDLASSFKRTIDRMVADMLAAKAATALFGDNFGAGGELGGFVGDIFKNFNLPSFDVGTPYVPHDMVANIHKGERILTADENRKFSSGQMSGQTVVQGPLFVVNTPNADSFMRSEPQIAAAMQRSLNRGRRIV